MDYQTFLNEIAQIATGCGRDPDSVRLLVVSKALSDARVLELYKDGARLFGESRVQQLLQRREVLPERIQWHLIGSLQRKKVKQVVGKTALIHSVDTWELAQEIAKRSELASVTTSILLQVNTSGEATKHGFSPDACLESLPAIRALPHLVVKGLMTMAPFCREEGPIRACFRRLRELKVECEQKLGCFLPELSMGMTHDYKIAIEEGATILRVGSLFGTN